MTRAALRRTAAALAASLMACVAAAQTSADGPYVVHGARGWEAWTVEASGTGLQKHVQPLAPDAAITVPAVGNLPAFAVRLRKSAPLAREVMSLPAATPLFVVADTHGEFEILAQMLVRHRVVTAQLAWNFGRGHLEFLGDVFDRGPNHTEILWLIYELEAQARRAGGGVHLLLGNHETMVLGGDLRYLNPKYRETTRVLNVASYSELFAADTLLGQWLRTRPVMLRIDRRLFLHGGVSRALVERGLSLAEVNASVRAVLSGAPLSDAAQRARAEFVLASDGPLWYRGYFPDAAGIVTATSEDVDRALAHFDVDTIFVGHTIVPTITPLYAGKVIAVQVYPRRVDPEHTSFECLRVRKGNLLRATFDGRERPLAAGPGD